MSPKPTSKPPTLKRCGALRKILPDELKKLQDAATMGPLTTTTLLVKHIEVGGKLVHVNTVKDAMMPTPITRGHRFGVRDQFAESS